MIKTRLERLLKKNENYITYACSHFINGLRALTIDDLKQECRIKLMQIIRNNKKTGLRLSDQELEFLFRAATRNLLIDIKRRSSRETLTVSITESDEDSFDSRCALVSFDQTAEYKNMVERIHNRLITPAEKQLFELILQPTAELVKLAVSNYEKKTIALKDGKNVFRKKAVEIENRHYATVLKVSPATISRLMKSITATVLAELQA